MHAKTDNAVEVAVIGAGIVGIAVAYYLTERYGKSSVLLIDPRQPMSYTSAQSGDNYRNWWPHATMTAFTNDSIDELDRLSAATDDVFQMTRGGYALATRRDDVDDFVSSVSGDIDVAVVTGRDEIGTRFPSLSSAIRNVIHIRRGGDISGQQLGQYMLERFRARGGKRNQAAVTGITKGAHYELRIKGAEGDNTLYADVVVNAAGPFAHRIAAMLDVALPVRNVYQQKIAFEDILNVIPRTMPFSIDLDEKQLNWSPEDRQLLADDDDLCWLTETLPSGTHCRPDGGEHGKWVKLGWAYNTRMSEPREDLANEPAIDSQFPEIVIRGAAEFIPALQPYVESPPTRFSHYGGYYTMTDENWPLIGPLDNDGAFIAAALSGFGSMSACAAGKLCAAYICGDTLPPYSADLSMARLDDAALLVELRDSSNKGLL